MKTLLYLIAVASVMLSICSCTKESYKSATVITDCTGTYLRWNEKDYKVCNIEKVASFISGTTVEATFVKLTDCKGTGNFPVACYLNHEYDSWIEVRKIK